MPEPNDAELKSEVNCISTAFAHGQNGNVCRFDIPHIQRDYKWDTGLAEDLWDHLVEHHDKLVIEREQNANFSDWYYLGSLVLWNNDNIRYVVDGQQRLTTITIMFCAIRDYLQWKIQEREILQEQKEKIAEITEAIQLFNEQNNLVDFEATPPSEDGNEGSVFIAPEEVEADEYDPLWTPELIESVEYLNTHSPYIDTFPINQRWVPKESFGEDHPYGDEQVIQFPEIQGAADFEFHPEAHRLRAISDLMREGIDESMIFYLQEDQAHLAPRLKLKGRDNQRLRYLQNPITGQDLTGIGGQYTREGPPGKMKMFGLGPETNRRYDFGNAIYKNYDLFINKIRNKFDEFGTTHVAIDEGGLPTSKEIIIHSDEQLTQALIWVRDFWITFKDHIQFTITSFNSIAKAYQAFVKINSLSLPLTLSDVIRALILSRLHGTDHSDAARMALDTISNNNDLSKSEDRFIRTHWISHNAIKRTESEVGIILSKEFEESTDPELLAIAQGLSNEVSSFVDFDSPQLPDEGDNAYEFSSIRFCFRKKAGVMQHLPLLMAAQRREDWGDDEVRRIHHICECVWMLHNRLGGSPSDAESSYSQCCAYINGGVMEEVEEGRMVEIPNDIDTVCEKITEKFNDALFGGVYRDHIISRLAAQTFKSNNVPSYILRRIEYHLQRQNLEQILQNLNLGGEVEYHIQAEIGSPEDVEVEHILPQSIGGVDYWNNRFSQIEHEDNVWRLGNLTLLNGSINGELQNRGFNEKRAAYSPPLANNEEQEENTNYSNIILTNKLLEYDEWTIESIEQRSADLAELILDVWDAFEFEERPRPEEEVEADAEAPDEEE